jgi:hypothetical protein
MPLTDGVRIRKLGHRGNKPLNRWEVVPVQADDLLEDGGQPLGFPGLVRLGLRAAGGSGLALQGGPRRPAAAPAAARVAALAAAFAADGAIDAERPEAGGETGPARADMDPRDSWPYAGPHTMTGHPDPDTGCQLDRKPIERGA